MKNKLKHGNFNRKDLSLSILLLLLFDLQQQRAVDVWQNSSKGDGGADERVELFVSTNGELEMAGSDTLDFEILGSILDRSASRSAGTINDLLPRARELQR